MTIFPLALGEVTFTILAFFLGIVLGTQLKGMLSRRTTLLVLIMSVVAAFLFEAPVHYSSVLGGVFAEHISFSLKFISAVIGLLVGRLLRGGEVQ
ncbi:MAG: hypothetical protein WHS82_05840 [Candidatus Methanosuratincola sp.]